MARRVGAEKASGDLKISDWRKDEIVIKSDGGVLYYTVEDKDGRMTLENASLDEIQASNPELYERRKVAEGDSYLDARSTY